MFISKLVWEPLVSSTIQKERVDPKYNPEIEKVDYYHNKHHYNCLMPHFRVK